MTFKDKYFHFIDNIDFPVALPQDVEILNPFLDKSTYRLSESFYSKYYADEKQRLFLIGINPGRFGAGITGVPFTDPVRLERMCQISNPLPKKQELSSVFVYEMIEAFGGVKHFYEHIFFTSVSPLGFVRNGKNLNYYDIPVVRDYLQPYMIKSLKAQIEIGALRKVAFSMGKGQIYHYLKSINEKNKLFDEIRPLPHPRWVMQYRLKNKQKFINEYVEKISSVLNL
jgi:hypothetical protein